MCTTYLDLIVQEGPSESGTMYGGGADHVVQKNEQ